MKNRFLQFSIATLVVLFFGCTSSSDGNIINSNSNTKRPINPITALEIQIGSQIWSAKNLNVSKYSDGTPIPQVTDPTQWENLTTGAWCYYNNTTSNGTTYGKLYNWYAVAGIYNSASATNSALRKKLAPIGWHIPTDAECSSLINFLDPNSDGGNNFPNTAGGKMKVIGTSFWQVPNAEATNTSGFTGLPGGWRNGVFRFIGLHGYWWSLSEELSTAGGWFCALNYDNGSVNAYIGEKWLGFSVRCVKD